jgi:hypothetical protein
VENYLTNEAGLTREDLDALKKVLLVPAWTRIRSIKGVVNAIEEMEGIKLRLGQDKEMKQIKLCDNKIVNSIEWSIFQPFKLLNWLKFKWQNMLSVWPDRAVKEPI